MGDGYLACKNPNCNSYGVEHPNCKCYGSVPDGTRYAKGGVVKNFCSTGKAHNQGCQYWKGGQVNCADGGFVLQSDDKDFYTLKHPKGDLLKIAKKGLSQDMHSQIQTFAKGGQAQKPKAELPKVNPELPKQDPELPKVNPELPKPGYAYGTDPVVKDPTEGLTPTPQAPVVVNVNSGPASVPQPQQAQPAVAQPQTPQLQTGPTTQKVPGADYSQVPNFQGQVQQSIGDLTKGVNKEAKAKSDYANAMIPLQEQQGTLEQQFADQVAQNLNTHANEIKTILDEHAQGLLDFNKAWQNKSTGNKLMAGLGILMSGIGSGLTGQPNLALQIINDEIENDIKRQQAATQGVNTVLGMYEKYHGNRDLAIKSTRAGALAMVVAKANQLLSKQNASMSDAERLQRLSPLVLPLQQLVYSNAVEAANLKLVAGGGLQQPQQQFGMNPSDTGNANAPTQPQPQSPGYTEAGFFPSMSTQQPQQTPTQPINMGRTGMVDMPRLDAMVMTKFMSPAEATEARKEAAEFQDVQKNKSLVLKALNDMSGLIEENRKTWLKPLEVRNAQKTLALLPFDIGKALSGTGGSQANNWGGEIGRKFDAAEGIAKTGITQMLKKRMPGQSQENIEAMMPGDNDTPQEIATKIQRIVDLFDASVSTPLLDSKGLIRPTGGQ